MKVGVGAVVGDCGQSVAEGTGSDLCRFASAVSTCQAATSALDQLRDKSHNFDLVLSDVYMPGKRPLADGFLSVGFGLFLAAFLYSKVTVELYVAPVRPCQRHEVLTEQVHLFRLQSLAPALSNSLL
jgi:hypothetical protein